MKLTKFKTNVTSLCLFSSFSMNAYGFTIAEGSNIQLADLIKNNPDATEYILNVTDGKFAYKQYSARLDYQDKNITINVNTPTTKNTDGIKLINWGPTLKVNHLKINVNAPNSSAVNLTRDAVDVNLTVNDLSINYEGSNSEGLRVNTTAHNFAEEHKTNKNVAHINNSLLVNMKGDNNIGVWAGDDNLKLGIIPISGNGTAIVNSSSSTSIKIDGSNSSAIHSGNNGIINLNDVNVILSGNNNYGLKATNEHLNNSLFNGQNGGGISIDGSLKVISQNGDNNIALYSSGENSSIITGTKRNYLGERNRIELITNADIQAKNGGLIDLYLGGKSSINGSIKNFNETNSSGTIRVDLTGKDSTWNASGTSSLDSLSTSNNSHVFLTRGNDFSSISVDNLSGDNGRYTFTADVENQVSSKLFIEKSSKGTHIAQVINDGSQNTTGKEKVVLIEDHSGINATAKFNSEQDIEVGGYSYKVVRDANNQNNWVLVGKENPGVVDPEKPGVVHPVKPIINDTAKSITGLAITPYLINQAEMTTLNQRMGDLTLSSTVQDVSGTWGRTYGGNYKTRNNDNLAKNSMDYYGFQLGNDWDISNNSKNMNFVGVFAGHTTAKPEYIRGNATSTSWYGGVYNLFITENSFYIDSSMKLGQHRTHYNLKDSQDNSLNGRVQTRVFNLSTEIGKRYTLEDNDNRSVYIEPQAQLTYSRVGRFNTKASNGLQIRQDAYNSIVGRVGLKLGTQIDNQTNLYLKTAYLHEFNNDINYKLNNSSESYTLNGDGIEAAIGGNVKINDNGHLYLEGNYIGSKSHYTGSKFNIGYRYSF